MELKNQVICGNVLEVLKQMPSEFVDCIITSPPYYGLRDYGKETESIWDENQECEHIFEIKENKNPIEEGKDSIMLTESRTRIYSGFCSKCGAWKGQLGLEPTSELYIKHMLQITLELKRVLKKTGTFWLNIGDTYGGSMQGYGIKNSDYVSTGVQDIRKQEYYPAYSQKPLQAKIKPKCLLMIPEQLALGMIEQGWILRNKIIWYKPNHIPSSVKDRLTNTWEYVYFFVKSKKYFFDLDAIREPPIGKNPGDIWEITTQPFKDAHFAVFPEKLPEKPILAGCPKEVCKKCGKPKERIIKLGEIISTGGSDNGKLAHSDVYIKSHHGHKFKQHKHITVGWSSCDCNAGFEPGIVLDPFCGSGTALVIAKKLGMNYIGIDIKQEYVEMAKRRLEKIPEKLINFVGDSNA